MKPADQYHAGIVVDDFEESLAWFSETAGYRWCEPVAVDQVITTTKGEETIPMRIAYSVDEPRLELIQTAPGTIWVPSTSGIHHLGYWSDDVDADVAVLEAEGLELEVTAPAGDGSSLWAYCKAPNGPRVELVSRVIEPALTQMFAAARADAG